jgi:hypothetical protein
MDHNSARDDIEIDVEKIRRHISDYSEASDRAEQRRIEDKILAETVWSAAPDAPDGKLVLNESQVQQLLQAIDQDNQIARMMLRRIYFE